MPENSLTAQHDVVMENRLKVTMTGILDVESFDEETVLAKSECGDVAVHGSNLKISRLSVESGDMVVEGKINALNYSDGRTQGGFLGRVFR